MAVQTLPRKGPAGNNSMAAFERKACEAAGMLKLLANENRLLILCRLATTGEASASV